MNERLTTTDATVRAQRQGNVLQRTTTRTRWASAHMAGPSPGLRVTRSLRPAPRRLIAVATMFALSTLALLVGADVPRGQAGLDQTPSEGWAPVRQWPGGPRPNPPGYLVSARYLVADEDGTVFVSDTEENRIQVFNDGGWTGAFGSLGGGAGQLDGPRGIAILGDELLVADSGNRRVARFDRSGRWIGAWEGFERPWALSTVPGSGRLLLTDMATSQVILLGADGSRLQTMGGPGSGQGQLGRPEGVAAWRDGRIAVADPDNDRIQLWASDGAWLEDIATGMRPALDVVAAGEDTLHFVTTRDVRTLDARGNVGGRTIFPERGNGGLALQAGTDATLWLTVRHDFDFLTGLRRIRLDGSVDVEQWMDFPEPPGELVGPRRVSRGAPGTATAFWVLDGLPRLQRLDATGNGIGVSPLTGLSEVEAAADGTVLALTSASLRRMLGDDVVWEWRPAGATPWLAALAHDQAAGLSYVLDQRSGSVHIVGDDGSSRGRWLLTLSGERSTFSDMSLRPDGRLFIIDRTRGEVVLREAADGTVVARWPVTGIPARVTADTDTDNAGGAFVLTRDGWVWRLDDAGLPRAWWDAATDAAGDRMIPSDISTGPGGSLIVLDGLGNRAVVFERDPLLVPPPAPAGVGCTFQRDKRAAPQRVTLGATIGVTLTVTGRCLEEGGGADVMIVLDRSGSMVGQKIAAASAAVAAFVGDLDFAQSRAGLITFSSAAELRVPLTDDPGELYDGLSGFAAVGGTDIGRAVDLATLELEATGRAGVPGIIVLMTDGRPDSAEVDADEAADRAKAAGLRMFTIGFGPDVDPALLGRMASAEEDYFFAPTETELAGIYLEIARRISGGILLQTATVTDVVPANMEYIVGSARPDADWNPAQRTLTWQLRDETAGPRLTYRLRPLQVGTHPTNIEAKMQYRDGLQAQGDMVFPVPRVTVVGPPRPIYLPLLMRDYCKPTSRAADVVLVIDTSVSMTGAKLTAAKLAARRFVDLLALPRDRAAIVSFSAIGTRAGPLSTDRDALVRAIAGLEITPGTVIDAGLLAALSEIASARPDALPAVILLTDGHNNAGPAPVHRAAAAVRASGARLYTIALGADADVPLMREIAGRPTWAFVAPGPEDLRRIYEDIAATIPCD